MNQNAGAKPVDGSVGVAATDQAAIREARGGVAPYDARRHARERSDERGAVRLGRSRSRRATCFSHSVHEALQDVRQFFLLFRQSVDHNAQVTIAIGSTVLRLAFFAHIHSPC
jgi:hypothetical protein